MDSKKVAVIGAGPSGTAVLRAFQSAREKGTTIPKIDCFEKQKDLGGLWNYTYRTGIDENGEPVHCSMYRYLWSNGPKECLEFADYTFEEHFGKPIASYPPREVLFDYIRGRIDKAGIRDWIKFECPVRWVDYDEKTKKFTLTAHNHKTNTQIKEVYDYVICCSGHFSTPNVPHFEGLERFTGQVMHAHDFRDAALYKGKHVMVIGASYSAEDIGSQCWKYGAKSITVSYRTAPLPYENWPDNWETKPLLERVEGNTCYFKDGTSKQIDVIILCTGYLHHFPFFPDSLRLKTNNRMWTKSLYKGVAFEDNPKMMYIGMQDQSFTFNMFDAQAWWARDVILNRIQIPDKKSMILDSQYWIDLESKIVSEKDYIYFQGDYVKEMIDLTDYPQFPVDKVCEIFMEWEQHKHDDIMGFRNNCYRSVMTGTMSPLHHTKWADEMDDSMATYLKN